MHEEESPSQEEPRVEVAGESASSADRRALSGLLGFAQGVLTARASTQMQMDAGLGVFREADVTGLPGVDFDLEDGAWFRLARQKETAAPAPVDHVARFLSSGVASPDRKPILEQAISVDVTIEEASDLEEAKLLRSENVRDLVEDDIVSENRVMVILLAEDCVEMRRDFDLYLSGPWSDWAAAEKPVRKAISLYNDLFKLHAAVHAAEATPPELICGMGIGRRQVDGKRVDMPIIEQAVDIDVEDGGAISIRPRELRPVLTLKPHLELEVVGADRLQKRLQESFEQILGGDIDVTPFTTSWEPLVETAAANLAESAEFISRKALDGGARVSGVSDRLTMVSSWALFGALPGSRGATPGCRRSKDRILHTGDRQNRGSAPNFFDDNASAFTDLRFNFETEAFEHYRPVKMREDPLWSDVTELMKRGNAGVGAFITELNKHPDNVTRVGGYIGRLSQLLSIREKDLHIEEVTGPNADWPDARETMKSSITRWKAPDTMSRSIGCCAW